MNSSILVTISNAAKTKCDLLQKNFKAYLISAVMAGIFIGLGGIFMGVVASQLTTTAPGLVKLISGLVFSVGLCCVTITGAELFTGNNFTMAVGAFRKEVSWRNTFKVWGICFIGNLIGSILIATLFYLTEIPTNDIVNTFFINAAITKTTSSFVSLFTKAILCNILVCLAIWGNFSLDNQVAKLLMNIACVATFVACGFEHSIANMSLITIALLSQQTADVTVLGFLYNILTVTVGNMLGGILFVALPCAVMKSSNIKKAD